MLPKLKRKCNQKRCIQKTRESFREKRHAATRTEACAAPPQARNSLGTTPLSGPSKASVMELAQPIGKGDKILPGRLVKTHCLAIKQPRRLNWVTSMTCPYKSAGKNWNNVRKPSRQAKTCSTKRQNNAIPESIQKHNNWLQFNWSFPQKKDLQYIHAKFDTGYGWNDGLEEWFRTFTWHLRS